MCSEVYLQVFFSGISLKGLGLPLIVVVFVLVVVDVVVVVPLLMMMRMMMTVIILHIAINKVTIILRIFQGYWK
jgi:hypothetical protein